MLYFQFLISAAIIVVAGIKLTLYADILSDRLKLGKVWIGIVLLGFVTSLPEAVASLTAVISLGANDLAVGNIMGSINLNIALIVIMDLLYREGSVTNKIKYDRENMLPVLFSACLTLIIIWELCSSAVKAFFCTYARIGAGSFFIFVVYFWGMKAIKGAMSSSGGILAALDTKDEHGRSLFHICSVLFFCAFFVVVGAMLLTSSADTIAEVTGLGRTFVGTIFLAFVTSLPELVVTLSALKLGNFGMAMGNIFGSNMTNIFILFLCDVFYRRGSLFASVSKAHLIPASLSILLICVVVLGVRQKNKRTIFGLGWDSYIIAFLFIAGMSMLYSYR